MNQSSSFELLTNFISDLKIARNINLTRETTLGKDLGIYGDDIEDFFYRFSKQFNVDLSSFKPEKYFESDWLTNLINTIKKKKIEKRELTLGDLEEAIKNGRLE